MKINLYLCPRKRIKRHAYEHPDNATRHRRLLQDAARPEGWLFGSFARGEETPLSDVDILVVFDPSQPVGLEFFGMWCDLERLLDRRVDLVTEGSLADFARESVERDKILIYERAA